MKSIESIAYPNLSEKESSASTPITGDYLSWIADVPVSLEVCIGHTRLTVKALQELREQQVLSLDKKVNETIELKLHGKTIATGELVVCEERFAIKLLHVQEKS